MHNRIILITMKTALTVAYILIGGLLFFAFMQNRSIKKMELALSDLMKAKDAAQVQAQQGTRTSVTGGELLDKLQNNIKSMDIKMDF